ncbi:hypothetical protein WAI453_011005 [Rhynchosporium graminicola]|uniref:Major facilitator superfamily (MFS) profile domain-containing protein n=1 Tax=Rhynchosporium graminicola TaxID=2792576 RepID=A0A1E1L066_9HELO|nr:uncharacterized protein RCO7_11581 [Rhynchosporium commune]
MKNTPQTQRPNLRSVLTYLTLSLAHTQVGFSTTSISGFQAMHGFLAAYGHPDHISKTGYNMGITPQQLAASFVNFGAMLGMLASVPLRRYLSRRRGLWFACVVSVVGSGLQLKPSNVAGLYARRCVIGISNGLFVSFAKVYAVESSPVRYKRGVLRGFMIWMSAGSLLGAMTNNFTKAIKTSWAYKIPLTCHITIPAVLVLLLLWVPESPGWLVERGKMNEARGELAKFRNDGSLPGVIDKELLDISLKVDKNREKTKGLGSQYVEVWKIEHRKRTLLCLALIMSNSASGIWLMLSYGTVMFQLAGIEPTRQAFHVSIYNNLANLLGTVLGLQLLRTSIRRRSMMIIGHFIPAICMLSIAVSSTMSPDDRWTKNIILVLIIAHGFIYYALSAAVAMPLCEEFVGEECKRVTVRFGMSVNYVLAWLITFTMPYFINPRELNWGPKVAYIWAASNFVAGIFFYFFLPESKSSLAQPMMCIFATQKSVSMLETQASVSINPSH